MKIKFIVPISIENKLSTEMTFEKDMAYLPSIHSLISFGTLYTPITEIFVTLHKDAILCKAGLTITLTKGSAASMLAKALAQGWVPRDDFVYNIVSGSE